MRSLVFTRLSSLNFAARSKQEPNGIQINKLQNIKQNQD